MPGPILGRRQRPKSGFLALHGGSPPADAAYGGPTRAHCRDTPRDIWKRFGIAIGGRIWRPDSARRERFVGAMLLDVGSALAAFLSRKMHGVAIPGKASLSTTLAGPPEGDFIPYNARKTGVLGVRTDQLHRLHTARCHGSPGSTEVSAAPWSHQG